MQCGIVCHRGTEKLCLKEICSILSNIDPKTANIEHGFVRITVASYDDIIRLSYFMRSALRVILLLSFSNISTFSSLRTSICSDISSSSFLANFLPTEASLCVICERMGTHDFKSIDVEKMLAQELVAFGATSNCILHPVFKNAQLYFYSYVYEKIFAFGIDFAGFDLSKRHYRVFGHQSSIKGSLAFCALLFGDFNSHDTILCPFCQDGILPIETTLSLTNISVHRYDHSRFMFTSYEPFQNFSFDSFVTEENREPVSVYGFDPSFVHLQATQKNAKIAGVHKYAQFSKIDSDWLFTKFEEKVATLVVSHLPDSFIYRKDSVNKIYSTFFSELQDVVDSYSRVVIITIKPDIVRDCATQNGFHIDRSLVAFSGKREYHFLKMSLDKANVNKDNQNI